MDMIEVGPILVPDFPMKVWPFLPSWPDSAAEPEVETTYNTEVIRSRSGVEQRSALRQWPRYRLRYERILWDEEYREAKAILPGGKRQPWFFRHPAKSFRLTLAVYPGNHYPVALDGWPGWVQPGRVLVLASGSTREAVFVIARDNNRLTLRDPVQNFWPQGAKVYAGLVGFFSTNTSLRKATDSVGRLMVDVEAPAVSNLPYYGLINGGVHSPHAILDVALNRLWPSASAPAFSREVLDVYPAIASQTHIIDRAVNEHWPSG